MRLRVADRTEQLVLGVGVEVGERDVRPGLGGVAVEQAGHELGGGRSRLREVRAPHDAAVFAVDPCEERRDHLAELLEHGGRVAAGLGQRVGTHAQQQRLERLAGAVVPTFDRVAAGRIPRAASHAFALMVCL